MNDGMKMVVLFRSRTPSKREWQAAFDLGSYKENVLAVLEVAWKRNADVVMEVK